MSLCGWTSQSVCSLASKSEPAWLWVCACAESIKWSLHVIEEAIGSSTAEANNIKGRAAELLKCHCYLSILASFNCRYNLLFSSLASVLTDVFFFGLCSHRCHSSFCKFISATLISVCISQKNLNLHVFISNLMHDLDFIMLKLFCIAFRVWSNSFMLNCCDGDESHLKSGEIKTDDLCQ